MSTSSINFEAVYSSAELAQAADALREWLEERPHLRFFTFDQLYSDIGKRVRPELINRVLLRLVEDGQLEVKFRAKISEREYSEEEVESLDETPRCVLDSAFEPHRVDFRDWVPAYAPSR
jgi:hypothetical protein